MPKKILISDWLVFLFSSGHFSSNYINTGSKTTSTPSLTKLISHTIFHTCVWDAFCLLLVIGGDSAVLCGCVFSQFGCFHKIFTLLFRPLF